MYRRCLWFLPLPLLLAILACNSSNNSLRVPSLGELLLGRTGLTQSATGLVQLVDLAGNPLDLPASGCAVVIGTSTLGAGTNRQGLFQLLGLPLQALNYWIGADGFLPQMGTIPQGATGLPPGTLQLHPDPNPNDNPRFLAQPQEPFVNVGTDGIPRFCGYLPNDGSVLKVFQSPGSNAATLDGAAGTVLQTDFGTVGQDRFFQAQLPFPLETGALYALLFSGTGVEFLEMYTCDLTINVTPRAGTRQGVVGTVAMPPTAVGASAPEVIAWEDGNFPNNIGGTGAGWDVLTNTGSFEGTLPTAPAAGSLLNVVVRWKDTAGNVHVCARSFP